MNTLHETIVALANARAETAERQKRVDEIERMITDSNLGIAHKKAMEEVEAAKMSERALYELVSRRAVAAFGDGKGKKPHAAVTVGEFKVVTIDEPDKLRTHCLNHNSDLLIVNDKAAKTYAKGVGILPGIKVQTEMRARVSRDLSRYVGTPEDEQ